MTKKTIGIICDHRTVADYSYQMAGDEYARAVADGAGALPLLIPSLPAPLSIEDILGAVDGILFTGSPSNVAPHFYDGPELPPGQKDHRDDARDALSLPLIRASIDAGMPALYICRGFQELNVALGGTLHPRLHEVPGFMDHRSDHRLSEDAQYEPRHPVTLTKGGRLEAIAAGLDGEFLNVNSLHGQGVARLAEKLQIEATAPDGVIEAVSLKDPRSFLLGVQWHPEWREAERPFSRAILQAFGDAVRDAG